MVRVFYVFRSRLQILPRQRRRTWRPLAAIVGLLLAVPWSSAAQTAAAASGRVDLAAIGPQVGQQVPEFRLTDQNGVAQTRESLAGPKGAMLVFFRSADW